MKRILFVGDIHLGSRYAILKDGFKTQQGQRITAADGFQQWAWKTWNEQFAPTYKNPDYLILMGDLTDGLGNINLGVDQLTTNLDEQVKMATDLLRMLIGPNTIIYGINGSGYHSGRGSQTDLQVVQALKGNFVGDAFAFTVAGKKRDYTFQFSHGGSAPLINKHTYIINEIRNAKDDKAENDVPMPDFLARAHQHTFLSYEESNIAGFVVPCWQAYTPYSLKKSSIKKAKIGAVEVLLDQWEEPIVHKILYRPPISIPLNLDEIRKFEEERQEIQRLQEEQEHKLDIKRMTKKRDLRENWNR